jgi:Bacterial Ig-like domain
LRRVIAAARLVLATKIEGASMRSWFSPQRPKPTFAPRIEGLETRLALSTVAPVPPVSVTSAHTVDSKSVTIDYDVNSPNLGPLLNFGVYRSADATFDAGDQQVASLAIPASALGRSTLDDAGVNAAALGHHTITLPVVGGLSIEPERPYVLTVANPETAIGAPDQAARTGVIHTHSIAVVTHGGIQSKSSDALGPNWLRSMAKAVSKQGFDSVVKYVWSAQSRTPGNAAKQGAKVDRVINRIAAEFPAGDPVDVQLIGHSEGAVVISQAAQLLQVKEDPGIAIGYVKMTMLDPHAANNHAPGYQYSIEGGAVGRIATDTIRLFQWQASDPIVSVPKNVDEAEVFYQHTRVEAAYTNSGVYNLWGQVPVRGQATYYDLTGPGISHAGDFSVPRWYTNNVAPTLGQGGHFSDPTILTGSRVLAAGNVSTKWYSTASTATPEFSGTAKAGATMTLFAARNTSFGWKNVGTSTADASGHWDIAPQPLQNGRYRFVVRAATEAFPGHPGVQITPRLRLGSVTIRGTGTPRRI